MKTITLFGSSGKTGQEIIQIALKQNFIVNAFCRNKNSISLIHEKLKIIEGNVLNPDIVYSSVIGSSYIISALGPVPPYKDIFCTDSARNIINSMKQANIERLVCITGAMIGNYADTLSTFMSFLKKRFDKSYPQISIDRMHQEKIIKESNLEWTILKPPRLANGKLNSYKTGENLNVSAFSSISRKTLAVCAVNILEDRQAFKKTIFVKE